MFDMTCSSHRGAHQRQGRHGQGREPRPGDRSGRTARRQVAAVSGVPSTVDDFEVLGSFYGHPAKLVRCETIDLLVPANAEIVIECELMATEGPHP